MNDGRDERSMRLARWWVRSYTAGLPHHDLAERRAEIDSDLAEHRWHRELEGWSAKRIGRERVRRVARGMAADLSWRHELLTDQCRVRGLVRMSVLAVTQVAAVILGVFHLVFAAYLLGRRSLADQRFLSGLDHYSDEIDRPVASLIAAFIMGGLGVALLAASLARPVSPLVANTATMAIAAVAAMFFWLGAWPVALVAVVGAAIDLATRIPKPAPHR